MPFLHLRLFMSYSMDGITLSIAVVIKKCPIMLLSMFILSLVCIRGVTVHRSHGSVRFQHNRENGHTLF